MGYLIDILIGATSRVVTSELSAHAEPMARWIIGKAAQRLPADDRDRFREEWIAHLDEIPGTLRKLWHAVGCHLGATKIAGVLAQQPRHLDKATGTMVSKRAPPPPTNVKYVVELKVGRAVISQEQLDTYCSYYSTQRFTRFDFLSDPPYFSFMNDPAGRSAAGTANADHPPATNVLVQRPFVSNAR